MLNPMNTLDIQNDDVINHEEEEVAIDPHQLPLADFIRDFGGSLLQAVRVQNPPIYNGCPNAVRTGIMDALKRKPYAAQQRVVQAVSHLLLDKGEKAAIINAEMGTGKTLMGIATAAVLHHEGYSRTLVLAPPHLVYKWRREIMETIAHAKVWVLNGPDALMKLIQLREQRDTQKATTPEFFIIGRVRLRLGFHWRPAFATRLMHFREYTDKSDEDSPSFVRTVRYAACPNCGEVVKHALEKMQVFRFPTEKALACDGCKQPLWTLMRAQTPKNVEENAIKALCQLPTIGPKRAAELIEQFGTERLMALLADNVYQFINLLDDKGNCVFSDRQALRMEKALAKLEFSFGQGGYSITEFIKRYLPKDYFSVLLVDEGHEYKSIGSAQGQAMGVLASLAQKVILLTGTLMGGYADDLFHLLWRINPPQMLKAGYGYSQRGSINAAANAFMEQHGVLKRVYRTNESRNHLTSRGKCLQANMIRAPGFGPQGVAHFVLPFTAFLKLAEIGQNVLPPYHEHLLEIALTPEQEERYQFLESSLMAALRTAIGRNDRTLTGVIVNCLLAWPDCCFREEAVNHPSTGHLIAYAPSVLDETPSPKEQQLIELCKTAKSHGQRVLVYTVYTGKRDTTARLKQLLENEDLKAAVLRASVSTDKREDWIAQQLENQIDVLICNPELVKTGLDLLEFPTIVFMQSGYSVYTLMQASRRSWRIGQKEPVNVYFLGYSGTAQIACLRLMAQKIAVSQSTAGMMPDTGLEVLNQDSDPVEVALAKQLLQ